MFARIAITKTRLVLLASFLFIGTQIVACGQSQEADVLKLAGRTMGTGYHITLTTAAGGKLSVDAEQLQADIDRELQRINQSMSTYIDDSELMRLNRTEVGQWMTLSAPLVEVLNISKDINARSQGAFDVTVGPLVNLWGFGPQMRPERVPSDDQLRRAKARTGQEKLVLDGQRAKREADIFVDLSAIAKGYGVDWIVRTLRERGFEHFMVEIGGEVRVAGQSPRGGLWRIGIEQPTLMGGSPALALALDNQAVATSGDYRNYYEVDGQRYSHTIDPETGRPITHGLASVTVVSDSAAKADAWATALNVLGPEQGMAVAEREKLAVFMLVKVGDGFGEKRSEAFKHMLAERGE